MKQAVENQWYEHRKYSAMINIYAFAILLVTKLPKKLYFAHCFHSMMVFKSVPGQ